MVTSVYLKSRLSYDPITGEFIWRHCDYCPQKWNTRFVGTVAGTIDTDGYRIIHLANKNYRAARLAWLYMKGVWPDRLVDHINTIRDDDSWDNLRLATQQQNSCNAKPRINNTSGFKNVSFDKRTGRFIVRIRINGIRKHIGVFPTLAEAHSKVSEISKELHQEFFREA